MSQPNYKTNVPKVPHSPCYALLRNIQWHPQLLFEVTAKASVHKIFQLFFVPPGLLWSIQFLRLPMRPTSS